MAEILYLTNDLLFSSRVSGAAKAAGVELRIVRSKDSFGDFSPHRPAGVLIDLEHPDALAVDWKGLWPGSDPRPATIAYGPHVKVDLLAAAQAAGIDVVLSRGQFDKQIGDILRSLVPNSGSPPETSKSP